MSRAIKTKVLWLSGFLSNYQFVSFGGCFWIFGASNNLNSMFLFSCHCTVSLSAVIVNKKILALLQGHFLPLFFRRNTLTCVTPKEKWNMFMLFLLGLRATHRPYSIQDMTIHNSLILKSVKKCKIKLYLDATDVVELARTNFEQWNTLLIRKFLDFCFLKFI